MASSLPSNAQTDSHPLSPDLFTAGGGRRGRSKHDVKEVNSTTSYFTLKAQSEQRREDVSEREAQTVKATWDGSVRGYGNAGRRTTNARGRGASLTAIWDRPSRPPPLFVVSPSPDHDLQKKSPLSPSRKRNDSIPANEHAQFGPVTTSQVLGTKWHDLSDEDIQSAISRFSVTASPSDTTPHPYHSTLRVLSAALEKLSRARTELEEVRSLLEEKEKARRERANELLKELQPSDQDVARRVLHTLFEGDGEEPRLSKRPSFIVSIRISTFMSIVLRKWQVASGIPQRGT